MHPTVDRPGVGLMAGLGLCVDEAFDRFRSICSEFASVGIQPDLPLNEAATRLKLIDPILVDVLGWSRAEDVWVELEAGEGRLDYLLRDSEGTSCLLIEAKKADVELVDVNAGKSSEIVKLTGPVLSRNVLPIVTKQMASYLGQEMPLFAVLTNGAQWVGFLGSLRQGTSVGQSRAIVFRSLVAIESDFERFFSCFSQDGVRRRYLQGLLSPEQKGVVSCHWPKRVVGADEETPLSYQEYSECFYDELRQAVDAAFLPIQESPDALKRCFVESRESEAAASRLERIATEMAKSLADAVEEYPRQAEQEINGAHDDAATGELDPRGLAGQGFLSRILGQPSAGKTVFLKRFFEISLANKTGSFLLIWIDIEKFHPFKSEHIFREALSQLKMALFDSEGPSWKHIREINRSEWNKLLRALDLSEDDVDLEIRKEFKDRIDRIEEQDPRSAFADYCSFALRNRQKLPCVVLDNVETSSSSEEALRWAVSVHLSTYCLCTVAMDDTSLWKMRKTGGDPLDRHNVDDFWLYRPKVRAVIENRIAYLKEVVGEASKGKRATSRTRLGRYRQFQWTVDPDSLARAVSTVLLDNDYVSGWLGQICNHDIRRVLELCGKILLSPHVHTTDLLAAQAAGQAVPNFRVMKAIVAPRNEQFQDKSDATVMNVFGFWEDELWAPMLPARLLAFLRYKEDQDRNRKEAFPGFVTVARLVDLFEQQVRVPPDMSMSCIEQLVLRKLIETYDPSRTAAALVAREARIRIQSKGRLHLDWAVQQRTYVRMMLEVDPIADGQIATELRKLWKDFIGLLRTAPTSGRKIPDKEKEVVALYVDYVLQQSKHISPLDASEALTPLRQFEDSLRKAWLQA